MTDPQLHTDSREAQLSSAWTALQNRWSDFRDAQVKSYNYAIGDMLDPDVRKELKAEGRPIFEFQLPNQTILYLAGKLKKDTTRIKAVPVRSDDVDDSEFITSLVNDWAMGNCDGYNEMAGAGIDAAVGKVGYVSNYWDIRRDPEGKWYTGRIDPFLVMFDPDCKKLDQDDCRFVSYSPMMSADEIIQVYKRYLTPELISEIRQEASLYENATVSVFQKARAWFDRIGTPVGTPFNVEREARRKSGLLTPFVDAKEGLYRVIEWHDRRTVTKKYVYSPVTRDVIEIPEEKHLDEAYIVSEMKKIPGAVVQDDSTELQYITVACPALIKDKFILEQPYMVQGHGYSIKWVLCYNFHPDVLKTQSVLDSLIAPVDMYNQRMMSSVQLVGDTLNPPIDAPKGSIDPDDMSSWRSQARGVIRFWNIRGGFKPEPRKPDMSVFNILQVLAEEGKNLGDYISAISPNARGYQESSKESGVLFESRRAASEVMTAHFFDNMQEFMCNVFDYTFASIQKFMTFERTLRLFNDEGDPYWLAVNRETLEGVMNDLTKGEYDFKPDIAAIGETARKEAVATLAGVSELFSADPVMGMAVGAAILRNMDVPEAKKLAAFAEQRIGVAVNAEQMQAQQQAVSDQLGAARQVKQLSEPAKKNGASNGKS